MIGTSPALQGNMKTQTSGREVKRFVISLSLLGSIAWAHAGCKQDTEEHAKATVAFTGSAASEGVKTISSGAHNAAETVAQAGDRAVGFAVDAGVAMKFAADETREEIKQDIEDATRAAKKSMHELRDGTAQQLRAAADNIDPD